MLQSYLEQKVLSIACSYILYTWCVYTHMVLVLQGNIITLEVVCIYVQLTNSSCNTEAGQHERCMASLCITTDISKLNTLGELYCFMLVCYLGKDKQLSVEEHMLVQQLSFMLCGCLVMSTKAYSECCWSWSQYIASFTVVPWGHTHCPPCCHYTSGRKWLVVTSPCHGELSLLLPHQPLKYLSI